MTRLFLRDGSTKLVDAPLIEICSSDGKSAVFILHREDGAVIIVQEGDKEFLNLCRKLNRDPAQIIPQ